MATLPLCATSPAAVAAAYHISRRPLHGGAMNNVHLLGRRGPSSSAPIKLQARRTRDSFRSHCDKRGADRLEPDSEPEDHDPDKVQNHPLVQELLDHLAANGVRMAPDMFRKENERLLLKLSCSADSRNFDETTLVANMVNCLRAMHGLNLASKVMDIARDSPGTTFFSQHTTDQMVRAYATILYNVADDAYNKKIGTEATISFLRALKGLGAICHILVQDTIAKLKDGRLKNKITHQMDKHSQEFYKVVNNLEDEVGIKEQKMVDTMLLYGINHTYLYISQLIEDRKLALDFLTSKE